MTAKTESVQYDHPNHTVTVTTISDLDLSGARLLGLPSAEVGLMPSPGEEGTGADWAARGLLWTGPCHGDSSARGPFPSEASSTAEWPWELGQVSFLFFFQGKISP